MDIYDRTELINVWEDYEVRCMLLNIEPEELIYRNIKFKINKNKSKEKIILLKYLCDNNKVDLRDSFDCIFKYAFNNVSIDELIIHNSELYGNSLNNCRIKSVKLFNSPQVYKQAFYEAKVDNVLLDNTLLIGNRCFYKSTLHNIEMNDVYFFGDFAFCECNNLEIANIPKVSMLGKSTFKNCENLKTIVLSDSLGLKIEEECFLNCFHLKSVLNTKTIDILEEHCFDYCRLLKQIDLSHVREIKSFAFNHCESLESLDLSNARKIYDYAFSDCYFLHEVKLKNIEGLGRNAFYNCKHVVIYYDGTIEKWLNINRRRNVYGLEPKVICNDGVLEANRWSKSRE